MNMNGLKYLADTFTSAILLQMLTNVRLTGLAKLLSIRFFGRYLYLEFPVCVVVNRPTARYVLEILARSNIDLCSLSLRHIHLSRNPRTSNE